MNQKTDNTQHFFGRLYDDYGKFLPVISFLGGFTWDSVTLTRIDRLSDNLILLGYLVLLGFSIIMVNLVENKLIQKRFLLRFSGWYPLAIQFFLGGLFSSYVIFYFKSASVTKNWIFLAILVIILFANEFLEKRLTNIYLQLTLYFLVIYSFLIFFIPVIVKRMNVFIFLLSGVLSLGIVAGFVGWTQKKWRFLTGKQNQKMIGIIAGLYLLINIFYFLNWIPPVPLALKYAGIFHQVHREGEHFALKFEKPPWYNFWKKSDNPFHYSATDTVYCFAAVFAPVDLNKEIQHRWQIFNPEDQTWALTDRLSYSVTGGRTGGYRGYTYKKNVSPGRWRVDIETNDGLIIGRLDFRIMVGDSLSTEFKWSIY